MQNRREYSPACTTLAFISVATQTSTNKYTHTPTRANANHDNHSIIQYHKRACLCARVCEIERK